MYNRILVPTDGSAGMNRVIDHASNLAAAHGAEMHFFYVVNTASFANLPMETSWENVTSMLRDEGEAALQAAERRADVDGVVTALGEGPPSKEIVNYADEEGCDLIVMGTHGRGGLNRLLLGSVAERVVRSSPIPVMTVRVGDDTEEARGEASERNAPESPVGEAME
ncbi:universal stress protein [Natronomonas halophila]|nr:universal stress protein [Natronomonas halophila]QLD84860.1 universal stress protein [Natronomonas halophila]